MANNVPSYAVTVLRNLIAMCVGRIETATVSVELIAKLENCYELAPRIVTIGASLVTRKMS